MENQENRTQGDQEWEKRTLCSDPACIGVIGPDGKCKECGRPYEGDAFEDSPFAEPEIEEPGEAPDEAVEEAEAAETYDDTESVTDEEWEKRTLCSDPACIGVIGPDGKCKECGKS